MPNSTEQTSNLNGSAYGASAWPGYGAAAGATEYLVDACQRAILFRDTLRERGNQYIEHERSNKPPVLAFEHETVLDGRNLPKPANYALLRSSAGGGVKRPERPAQKRSKNCSGNTQPVWPTEYM
jgi:hypothetical protein